MPFKTAEEARAAALAVLRDPAAQVLANQILALAVQLRAQRVRQAARAEADARREQTRAEVQSDPERAAARDEYDAARERVALIQALAEALA